MKSDRINLLTPASPVDCLLLLTYCPCGTVKAGTGKVDPARKFKCTTAARDIVMHIYSYMYHVKLSLHTYMQ